MYFALIIAKRAVALKVRQIQKKIFTILPDKRSESIKYYAQGADLQSTVNRSLNKREIAQTRRTFGRIPLLL